jgi:serine/threonine protein phosphatase 1
MRIAIGDIHGCCRTLQALLEKIKLQEGDELYLLGDYIDRGPDSKGVLDTIMHLPCKVVALKGNHEDLWIKAVKSGQGYYMFPYEYFLEMGMVATARSFGNCDITPYVEYVASLPLWYETEDYLFVHGEFDFSLPDPFGPEGEESMLWSRGKEYKGGKPVICGHTPLPLWQIKESLSGKKIDIDNGCCYLMKGYGRLLAYDLDRRCLYEQENIDYHY